MFGTEVSEYYGLAMAEETRRDRQRRELVAEIKSIARSQLEAGGRAGVSWRGIARDVGMNPASLYTYFASLDDLFTALILDSYGALAEATEAAAEVARRRSARNRLVAIALGYRTWALEHRAQYNLIFTDVLPGYEAPPGGPTVAAQVRVMTPFIEALGEMVGAAVDTSAAPSAAQERAYVEWLALLHGQVTLEVNHHLDWVQADLEALFVERMGEAIDSIATGLN